jgi:Raf kinase inhibitor-like YbhB/YbcL family protein
METNSFFIESTAFKYGEFIPAEYTAEGRNVSPPLEWSQIPPHAESFAIICEDPDALHAPYVHWVIYNIPRREIELKEGIPTGDTLSSGAVQGLNSSGTLGYVGPQPPPHTGIHRYYFRIFALDEDLRLQPGLNLNSLMDAIRTHIVGEAELLGKSSYH